ncbi:ADP-ribosylglycohydrolase family protein [Arthrobacter sp. RHLT1-20]
MKLTPLHNDRAAGVLVALAAGDALGAGYEFGAPLPDGAEVTMKGGGPFGFAPAEWTDDTSMAIPIAQALLAAASDAGSSSPAALTMVVRAWTAWAAEAKDVGAQTSSVIAAAGRLASTAGRSKVHAADFSAAAADFHARTGRSAGNGSLMRTAPLALAYLEQNPAELMAQAVRGGRDTDTVAAIAGGLLGAAYGYTAVPFEWRRRLHGWPGLRVRDLMMLGMELGRGEGRRPAAWPRAERQDYSRWGRTYALIRHPHDAGVWLGGVGLLQRVAELGIDAVVSLCRLGTSDVPGVAPEDHATFWVVDSPAADDNADAAFVLRDAAATVERFRAEGKTVLLHCVRAESRTPTVAALYGARLTGITPPEALEDVQRVLPGANPNGLFLGLLRNVQKTQ